MLSWKARGLPWFTSHSTAPLSPARPTIVVCVSLSRASKMINLAVVHLTRLFVEYLERGETFQSGCFFWVFLFWRHGTFSFRLCVCFRYQETSMCRHTVPQHSPKALTWPTPSTSWPLEKGSRWAHTPKHTRRGKKTNRKKTGKKKTKDLLHHLLFHVFLLSCRCRK